MNGGNAEHRDAEGVDSNLDRRGAGEAGKSEGADAPTHDEANRIDKKRQLALETVMRICGNDFQTASRLLGEEWKERDIYRFMKDQVNRLRPSLALPLTCPSLAAGLAGNVAQTCAIEVQ